jgi:hypothetical protein
VVGENVSESNQTTLECDSRVVNPDEMSGKEGWKQDREGFEPPSTNVTRRRGGDEKPRRVFDKKQHPQRKKQGGEPTGAVCGRNHNQQGHPCDTRQSKRVSKESLKSLHDAFATGGSVALDGLVPFQPLALKLK